MVGKWQKGYPVCKSPFHFFLKDSDLGSESISSKSGKISEAVIL